MSYANFSLAKTDIIKQIGYFPAFLIPAIDQHAASQQRLGSAPRRPPLGGWDANASAQDLGASAPVEQRESAVLGVPPMSNFRKKAPSLYGGVSKDTASHIPYEHQIISDSSPIYRSLTQQTLFAYINNPLPAVFKEKLFIALSRYCGVEYFTICHSCSLYSLGLSAAEILELRHLKYPQSEAEAIAELQNLKEKWETDWQHNSHLTACLLHCANFIFLQPEKAVDFSADLKQLIGNVRYHYLIVLLGYIKLCHQWVKNHPQISHRDDRRSQLYLGSLLLEETKLANFFQNKTASSPTPAISPSTTRSPLSTQLAAKNGELATQIAHLKLDRKILEFDLEQKERLTIAVAKDLGELVLHNTKLAELEAKLKSTLEATNTGTWNWDLVTNKIDLCQRSRAILGLNDFDGSYLNFLQAIHLNERESIDLEAARAIQNHRDLNLKCRVIRPCCQEALICIKGRLHYNYEGQPASITGILTEIPLELSQPKAIESQSQAAVLTTTQFKAIADVLPYYLLVVDAKTEKILLLNTLFAKSLQISNSEAIGKSYSECFDSKYAERIAWHHQQAISGDRVLRMQEKVTLADGIHYLDTTIAPLHDPAGEVYALLHTSNEIPDLAATQEVLSQRTIQLEAANRELESFSYSVSHDLQAPLRVINGFSQVLWENYQSNLDDRGQHYLQRIRANSERMSNLIDALLQLSRVTRSQMKSVKVNLSAIATDIVEELRIEDPERQVEVQIAPNLETKGDPQLLRIVLSNLLNNAWKYTSGRSQATIEFNTLASDERQTTYYVKDNGAGFNLEYADKLFTPFQRLHSQAEFPGTGIGLATVQRIIYRHGGKVWAEGECDRGATIYFSL